jgi:hypothetical protein
MIDQHLVASIVAQWWRDRAHPHAGVVAVSVDGCQLTEGTDYSYRGGIISFLRPIVGTASITMTKPVKSKRRWA